MNKLLTLVIYMSLLTWVAIIAASMLRAKGWTPKGLMYMMGNRDEALAASPMSKRADRAASNTKENFILFVALAFVAQISAAQSPLVEQGASLFFLARVIYLPVYYIGIPYVRTLVWVAGLVGLGMMIAGVCP